MLFESSPSKFNQKIHKNVALQPTTNSKINTSSKIEINKLLQKDLKEMIFSLEPNELISLFKNLQIQFGSNSSKQFTKIGHKCSECHISFEGFQSKGYGRQQHEALLNSIKIVLESMITASFKIQSIKKALKYCSKFKQPLINSNNYPPISSSKKSMKKVQTIQQNSMAKKHLEYAQRSDSANKQNISKTINETLDLNTSQIQQKIKINSKNINLRKQNFLKQKSFQFTQNQGNNILNQESRQKQFGQQKSMKVQKKMTSQKTLSMQDTKALKQEGQNLQKCLKNNECIYFQIQKASQRQIKNLMARIKLLQQENTMLKELLLKDKSIFSSVKDNQKNSQKRFQ